MEEHRLKPMVEHDPALFNQIYKDTELLRRKLAWQIDERRFGVDKKEILSWFTVKFLHAFNRYYENKSPDLLKAHIIQSLQFFKQRILRFAYSQKAQLFNTVDVQETLGLSYDSPIDDHQTLLELSMSRLKATLSPDAFKVLTIELYPPLYIINWFSERGKPSTTKIPSKLIAEYLDWGPRGVKKVADARLEIAYQTDRATQFFSKYKERV